MGATGSAMRRPQVLAAPSHHALSLVDQDVERMGAEVSGQEGVGVNERLALPVGVALGAVPVSSARKDSLT